jgi:hypothetical protein
VRCLVEALVVGGKSRMELCGVCFARDVNGLGFYMTVFPLSPAALPTTLYCIRPLCGLYMLSSHSSGFISPVLTLRGAWAECRRSCLCKAWFIRVSWLRTVDRLRR